MKEEFKFEIDQKVATPFDEDGLVDFVGFDGEGKKYLVKTKNDSQWFKEDQLTAIE